MNAREHHEALPGVSEFYQRLFTGSMPELYAENMVDWEIYYRSYVNTYLQRGIRDLAQVADEMQLCQFITAVAANTSKSVVYEELASEAGISSPTAKKWLSVHVSSHIVALVQPYYNNVLKRVVKTPLLHFLATDTEAFPGTETFSGMKTLKVKLGTGGVICMSADLLPSFL